MRSHTHTRARLAKPPTFPLVESEAVWERESDWLSGLASSPAACQLAVYSSTAVGVPAA